MFAKKHKKYLQKNIKECSQKSSKNIFSGKQKSFENPKNSFQYQAAINKNKTGVQAKILRAKKLNLCRHTKKRYKYYTLFLPPTRAKI